MNCLCDLKAGDGFETVIGDSGGLLCTDCKDDRDDRKRRRKLKRRIVMMRTPDSDKDEDPLSDFKLVEKVTIDYGDAGTCDAGAVQKVSDEAPLVYVTLPPNMRLRSKTNPHESPAKFRRIVDIVD